MTDPDRRSTLFDSYENAAMIVSGIDAEQLGHPTPLPEVQRGRTDRPPRRSGTSGGRARSRAGPPARGQVPLRGATRRARTATSRRGRGGASLGRRIQILVEVHHAMGRGVHGGHSGGHVPGRAGRTHLGLSPGDRTARQVGPLHRCARTRGGTGHDQTAVPRHGRARSPIRGGGSPTGRRRRLGTPRRLHGTRPTGIARSVGAEGRPSVAIAPKIATGSVPNTNAEHRWGRLPRRPERRIFQPQSPRPSRG